MVAAFVGLEAPPRVYINEEIQDIIWAAKKARPAAAKNSCEHPFKVCFSNVYKNDNQMAYYNFCQQCKDHFATARVKRPNRIIFAISFF